MSTRFFTNLDEHTLFKKFQGVFQSNPDIERFDALVGYLRSSGYFALRPYLEKVPHIRILVGINVDAIMADYHRRGLLFLADPTKALDEFRNWLGNDIQSAEYKRDVEIGVLQFVDDVISKKIELRAHPTKRLHAKLYIFRPKGFNEHKPGAVIAGKCHTPHIERESRLVGIGFVFQMPFGFFGEPPAEGVHEFLRVGDRAGQPAVAHFPLLVPTAFIDRRFDAADVFVVADGGNARFPQCATRLWPVNRNDPRVQAAWPVIADALNQVELWKIESSGKKPSKPLKPDASSVAFTRFFRDTVNDETVPDGIPPAVPWEELEKKMKVPKQAKNVRGKLNVPRERFRLRDDGYVWAGIGFA